MHADRALAAIAARQHGVVTLRDLRAAGIERGGLDHRLAAGRLRRLHRGVFLLGPLLGPWTREQAAVLAVGGALSHDSAAALWGFRQRPEGDVHVTVAGRNARSRPGISVHRTSDLEVRHRDGIPLTSPAQTLEHLRATLAARELERAAEQAQILRLITRREAARFTPHQPAMTRSEAEVAFLRLIRDAGLPPPEANVRVHGYEVDFLWRERRLVVEVDGYAYHSTREAFERDRRKDAHLQAHGLRTTRVTYRQIAHEPLAVTVNLTRQLYDASMRPIS